VKTIPDFFPLNKKKAPILLLMKLPPFRVLICPSFREQQYRIEVQPEQIPNVGTFCAMGAGQKAK
jgi:hypothetical protein